MRFQFGKNWKNFSSTITSDKIQYAIVSLSEWFGQEGVQNKTFLDAGSGSGLFSLAACRLGASKIRSFDYDKDSVECSKATRDKYNKNKSTEWNVSEGDLLNPGFVQGLGSFDIVYCWGVAHHTGNMWKALENLTYAVKPEGHLFVALYNDQGFLSQYWLIVKKIYNSLPGFLKEIFLVPFYAYFFFGYLIMDLLRLRNPLARFTGKNARGMSIIYDVRDWVGGYPFEVCTPKELQAYFENKSFKIVNAKTVGHKHGCNEFLLKKVAHE